MPVCEGRAHQRTLVVPPGLRAQDEVLLIRFTGEVFNSYEDYIKALNQYRKRIWICKYTGEGGLTYEEAVAAELSIDSVVSKFPSQSEEAAARLVHQSLKSSDALVAAISKLAPGVAPETVSAWVQAVAYAEPVSGVPGVDCLWRLTDYFRDKYGLPEALPPELAESLRPARSIKPVLGTLHDTPSANADGLHAQVTGQELYAAAAAEEDYEGGEGYESYSDFEDDDYKPTRFSVEDLPWRARGRGGRVGTRGRGGRPGRGWRGRGRGRGRWGRGASPPDPLDSEMMEVEASALPTTEPELAAPTAQDLVLLQESLEEVERRMQPGSIKHGVLLLLKEAGEAGMTVNEMVTAIQERNLKTWDEPKQARNSIASTCGHDPAFVRVGPGRFALRCLVPAEALLPGKVALEGLDEPAARQVAAVEAAQAEAMRKLAEQKTRGRVERNNFKCPKCHRITHAEASPLVLCDTCPRGYHLTCLGQTWADLPTGDWCCPKCVESTQAALRRVMDLESRKKEALERAVNKEKAAEDKLVRRLLSPQDRAGGNAGGGGTGGGPSRQPRRIPDDWEVLEEEKEHLTRLEIRVKELRELALRGSGTHALPIADHAQAEPMDVDQHHRKAEHITDVDDAAARATEAEEALEKLRSIVGGPPKSFPQLFNDPRPQRALSEAAVVTEFLALYGAACAIEREFTAKELVAAVAWPLDHSAALGPLYRQLLLCCLLAVAEDPPPMRSRVQRWLRVVDTSTWPEILRRYLLCTRVHVRKAASSDGAVEGAEGEGYAEGEGGEDGDAGDTGASSRPLAGSRRSSSIALTSLEADAEPLEGDPLDMDDRSFAIHSAALLSRGAWWQLPGVVHLRLLGMLCYDIAQGRTLRDDINERVVDCTKLATDWARESAAARRQKRASAGAETQGGNKRRKSAGPKKGAPTGGEGEGTDGAEAQGDADDPEFGGVGSVREAEIVAQMEERVFRTDPLGCDRYLRRFWWLRGFPGYVFVEDADGVPVGVVDNQATLDDLLSKLNRRAPREQELYGNLKRKYDDIVDSFSAGTPSGDLGAALDVFSLPRPTPTDGRVRQKDLPTLAAMSSEQILSGAKEVLDSLLTDTLDVEVRLEREPKAMRKELRGCETADQLCLFLIGLEAVYSAAGEGLPPGADPLSIAALIGEEDAGLFAKSIQAIKSPENPENVEEAVRQEKGPIAGEVNSAEAFIPEDAKAPSGVVTVLPPPEGDVAPPLTGIDIEVKKEEEPSAPDAAHPTTGTATIGPTPTATATGTTLLPPPVRPVTLDDDFDDSDAEHAFLREKRMRRPARLWRSARERAVWLKGMCAAVRAAGAGQGSAPAHVAFCAYLLDDRAKKMLKVVSKLVEDAARYEEAEAARLKAEAAAKGHAHAAGAATAAPPSVPTERPLMIRTGKSKTDEGVKVVLKLLGKDPFPQGRAQGSASGGDAQVASEEQIAACRWGYQCSVCLLAGDLLCCEHPDGCAVSVHPGCTGLPFPQGPYICSNHDDRRLKGRMRMRRGAGSGVGRDFVGGDDEATESEATISDEDTASEVDSEATRDEDDDGGRRRGRR